MERYNKSVFNKTRVVSAAKKNRKKWENERERILIQSRREFLFIFHIKTHKPPRKSGLAAGQEGGDVEMINYEKLQLI